MKKQKRKLRIVVWSVRQYIHIYKWFKSDLSFWTRVRMLWIKEIKFQGKYWDVCKKRDEYFANRYLKFLSYEWKFDLFGPKHHGLVCYYVYDNQITRWLGFKEENDKARTK